MALILILLRSERSLTTLFNIPPLLLSVLFPSLYCFRLKLTKWCSLQVLFSYWEKTFWLFFFLHLFTCAYIVWVNSPPCPPQFHADPILPLSLILLKKRYKYNKKDKAFLLVELRIAIQKNSYHCFHVPMCHDPCWFSSNWSLHWFLIPCS
jgi:hypothetical protein